MKFSASLMGFLLPYMGQDSGVSISVSQPAFQQQNLQANSSE